MNGFEKWLMENYSFLVQMLVLIGSSFFGFVKFILPKLFDRYLELRTSRAIEEFKSELETKRTKELDSFRDSIKEIGFQRETQFAALHKKQAEIIPGIYSTVMKIDSRDNLRLFFWPYEQKTVTTARILRRYQVIRNNLSSID